ncbi:MAG: ABC transporter permease [Gemmataceae bacterium]
MPLHVGPGPVFRVEAVAAARRWQMFAARAGLIAILLVALSLVWYSARHSSDSEPSIHTHAAIGEAFTLTILTTQLTIILLAAPAATAGAICIDKMRGNLVVMFATDLSNFEIVLGKLFARLLPVFGLVIGSLPVFFIASLLGGIAPDVLLGGFVTIIGAGVFACAIAIIASLYVGKTHEALLLTYLALLGWNLSYWIYKIATPWPVPPWLASLNPFLLLFAPTDPSEPLTTWDYVYYLAFTLGTSALMALVAAWRLRRVVIAQLGQLARVRRGIFFRRRGAPRLLARSPMNWYERHRKRPSRASRLVWAIFGSGALLGTGLSLFHMVASPALFDWLPPLLNCLQVGVGLLLVTVYAVTALADERARGSLDVLMTTPVTTREIVWAKWRSAFSLVPKLVVLPGLIGVVAFLAGGATSSKNPESFRYLALALIVLHPLACGAMLASVGLFCGTWFTKFSRSVGAAVCVYVFITVGGVMLIMVTFGEKEEVMTAAQFSPLLFQFFGTLALTQNLPPDFMLCVVNGGLASVGIYLTLAIVFYYLTRRIFDRCMGRTPERGLQRRRVSPRFAGYPEDVAPAIVVANASEHEQEI